MFADTRYLPSLLSLGLRSDRAATALYNDLGSHLFFKELFTQWLPATQGTEGKGAEEGVVWNINHKRASFYRQQFVPFFVFDSPLFLAFFIVGWGDKDKQDEVLSAAANVCNYEEKRRKETLILCMNARSRVHVCACWGGEVIKENIPQGGSIVVIQTCMGLSIGSTDTVLRVCWLYWF